MDKPLQWGRGQLTADDMSVGFRRQCGVSPLQWGRGQLTADDPAIHVVEDHQSRASMGPRSADRG